MSLIDKTVLISTMHRMTNKPFYHGTAKIIDKVLMDKATYSKSPLLNNASMNVYIGQTEEKRIVLFLPDEILEIKSK